MQPKLEIYQLSSILQPNRARTDGEGSSSAATSTAPSSAAPTCTAPSTAPRAPTAPSRPATAPRAAPTAGRATSTASRPQDFEPGTSSASTSSRGIWPYFTAGRNASAGRDPNVGPLDGSPFYDNL